MPSGPKKRKKAAAAAAKKKEEEEQMGSISSTTPLPPQQEKKLEQKGEMERSESAKEGSPSSEIPVSEAKDVSNEVVHSKEEEEERSAEVLLEKGGEEEASAAHLAEEKEEASEVKDVGHELVEAKEEAGGSNLEGETSVTEIVLKKPSVDESEQAVEASETSVAERRTELVLQTDPVSIAPASEEVVEASEVPVSVQADSGLSEGEESREMPNMGTIIETSVTGALGSAPLLEHRASVWNCCGLLDVFKGSQR